MAGHYPALVLELVDKRDLKSLGQKCPYGFDPRPEHDKKWQVSYYQDTCHFSIDNRLSSPGGVRNYR